MTSPAHPGRQYQRNPGGPRSLPRCGLYECHRCSRGTARSPRGCRAGKAAQGSVPGVGAAHRAGPCRAAVPAEGHFVRQKVEGRAAGSRLVGRLRVRADRDKQTTDDARGTVSMPLCHLVNADGTEEVVTIFDGQIWAEHADGSRCPRTGKGKHRQRPLDPRCPGRTRYIARCRSCGWKGEGRTHETLKKQTKLHAQFCDDQKPRVMTAKEWCEMQNPDSSGGPSEHGGPTASRRSGGAGLGADRGGRSPRG